MNSQELLERSAQEREKIFERYELGREAPIDSWEDPEYNVYSLIDRFGFIHDQKIQSPEDDKKTLVKKLEVLAQREKKWVKMLSKWDSKSTKEKLQKRIYKGVPDKVRALVWTKLLNLSEIMSDKSNENKYQEMLELARVHSTEARQIDSDVNRQFRENIFFRERYNQRQKSLFNVLVAYSMWNSEVSYCQGMSTLAGMLLMYLGEEETFWALNVLLTDQKFAMHGLFILGFPKLTRFLAHHDKILAKFLPKLKRHFDQCNLDSILYSLKWFFVIFVERIPFSLCLRVWDIYLLEGEKVSTAMAYAVLKLHKSKLLKLKDLDSIVHFLQVQLPKDFGYDDDFVIKALEQCSEELRKAKMELPPPATDDNELPQKPLGVFVEPTKDEKIGHRKSDFSSIEKEVTDSVIKNREQAEIESHVTDGGLDESNSQLNTAQIPESEDGASLNLSKRSLADTSVTSTADLSVFSGGDRRPASEQRYHNEMLIDNSLNDDKFHYSDVDLHNIAIGGEESRDAAQTNEDEENGESSPSSLIKSSSTIQIYQKMEFSSSSVVNKSEISPKDNSSETPTPTIAYQPNQDGGFNNSSDIVRIYVPPAENMIPSESKNKLFQRDRGDDEISQCSNRSSIIHVEYETLPYDISPTPSNENYERRKMSPKKPSSEQETRGQPPIQQQQQQQQQQAPQQYYYYPHQSSFQSSSSRRGSMTRKTPSPMIESDIMIECDHMRMRKMSQENLNGGDDNASMNYSLNGGSNNKNNNKLYQLNNSNGNDSIVISPMKRLTSFEELAKKSESNSLLYIHEIDNNYSTSSRSKPKSDYNICYNYKNLDENEHEDGVDYPSIKHQMMMIKKSTSQYNYNVRRSDRKHSSSDNNNSPFDYDLLREKKKDHRFDEDGRVVETETSIKSYDRFFNSDDDVDEEYEKRYSSRKKTSSNKYRSHISGTEADDDENSSNSPPMNKSVTPLNECIPLLSCDAETTIMYQSAVAPSSSLIAPPSTSSNSNSLRQKSRIPLRVGSNRKNSSMSSPDSDDKSDNGYQTAFNQIEKSQHSPNNQTMAYHHSSPSHSSSSRKSTSKSIDSNKIRIKINQNN